MKKINNNLNFNKYQNILLINRLNIFILIYYKTSHEKNNYNIQKKILLILKYITSKEIINYNVKIIKKIMN